MLPVFADAGVDQESSLPFVNYTLTWLMNSRSKGMDATRAWLGMHQVLTSDANNSHPGGRFAVKLSSQLAGCSFKIRDHNDGDFCVSIIPLAEVLFAKDSCGT